MCLPGPHVQVVRRLISLVSLECGGELRKVCRVVDERGECGGCGSQQPGLLHRLLQPPGHLHSGPWLHWSPAPLEAPWSALASTALSHTHPAPCTFPTPMCCPSYAYCCCSASNLLLPCSFLPLLCTLFAPGQPFDTLLVIPIEKTAWLSVMQERLVGQPKPSCGPALSHSQSKLCWALCWLLQRIPLPRLSQ